jgi:uncharacterized membrane protein
MKVAFLLLYVGIGLLFVALAMPLIRRRVKPNGMYGLRIPATFADEWVWYEANARTGRDLLYIGLFEIIVALLLAPLPFVPWLAYVLVNAAVLLFGAIGMCIVGVQRANRLLKERRSTESRPAAANT